MTIPDPAGKIQEDFMGGTVILAIVHVTPPSGVSTFVDVAPLSPDRVSAKSGSAAARTMVVSTQVCVSIVGVQSWHSTAEPYLISSRSVSENAVSEGHGNTPGHRSRVLGVFGHQDAGSRICDCSWDNTVSIETTKPGIEYISLLPSVRLVIDEGVVDNQPVAGLVLERALVSDKLHRGTRLVEAIDLGRNAPEHDQ